MTQVTGPLRDVLGNLLANTTCTIYPKADLTGQNGGATALRKGVQVTTDGSGVFDADIQPGEHILTVHVPTLGTSYLSTEVVGAMAVPEDEDGVTLEYAMTTNVSEMTATILQRAIDAKDAAEASASEAALYDGPWVDDVSALIADTALTYTASQPGTVEAGDIIRTRAEGFCYEVASSGATDHHVTTAGGVKLKVLADQRGYRHVDAFGAAGDGATDDSAAFQKAINAEPVASVALGAKTYIAANIPLIHAEWELYGPEAYIINNLAGANPMFVFTSGSNFARSKVTLGKARISGSGGHMFDLQDAVITQSTIRIGQITNLTTDYKIMTNEGDTTSARYFFNKFYCDQMIVAADNTAANQIQFIGDDNYFSSNTFQISDLRLNPNTRFAYLECTSTAGANFGHNKFENIGAELIDGGLVTMKGCNNSGLENVSLFDNTTIADDIIVFDTGSGGTLCEQCYVKDYQRRTGTIGSFFDIKVVAGQSTFLQNIGHPLNAQCKINANDNEVISLNLHNVDLSNGGDVSRWDRDVGFRARSLALFGDETDLTISGGAITCSGSGIYTVDTEGGSASDTLDTINGTTQGDIIFLRQNKGSRVVTIEGSTGGIRLKNGSNQPLNNPVNYICLYHTETGLREWGHYIAKSGGWESPTGTATKTTFDTATVTTEETAERLKALIDDLTDRGLLGS